MRQKTSIQDGMRQISRFLPTLCCLSLFLIGCATQQTSNQSSARVEDWNQHQAQLNQLDNWRIQGKLGLRLPHDSNSVYVNWNQQPDGYAIRLSGPFGQGTTWIRGNDKGVRLEQVGRDPISAETPEELISRALGWDIPIRDLYYWVRGIPAPNGQVLRFKKNAMGTLSYLEQGSWKLTYSQYNPINNDNYQTPLPLPGKIVAQHDSLKLILAIKEWQFDHND